MHLKFGFGSKFDAIQQHPFSLSIRKPLSLLGISILATQIQKYRVFVLLGKALKIPVRALPTLAIIAYFSGWQYANEYFSEFGINRSNIAFNDYTVFTQNFSKGLANTEFEETMESLY